MKKLFFYLLPFILFFSTYIFLIYYYQSEKIIVPSLVGKNFSDIVNLSSDFNFKIYKVTSNKEYPHHYILSQYPQQGSILKKNHSLSIEVNLNENISKFDFKNKNYLYVIDYLKKEGVNFKTVDISLENKKNNIVIASKFDFKKNILYLYRNIINESFEIYIKNCINLNCQDLNLEMLNIHFSCYDCQNFLIKDSHQGIITMQYPLPGVYIKNKSNFIYHIWHENMQRKEI